MLVSGCLVPRLQLFFAHDFVHFPLQLFVLPFFSAQCLHHGAFRFGPHQMCKDFLRLAEPPSIA